jgi:type IV pilus assembly protein PilP
MVVMAGVVALLALPVAAQMVPARPKDVRTQLNQAAPGSPAVPATQSPAASAAPAAQTARPATAAPTAPRRDPFDPLLGRPTAQGGAPVPERLPPGKAGLMIGTLRIDGLVRAPNGMIAVVSNPQQRVYFLREGDRVFDGQVARITMEAVSFRQTGRDAFGTSQEREVIRRLYPNPGEQR